MPSIPERERMTQGGCVAAWLRGCVAPAIREIGLKSSPFSRRMTPDTQLPLFTSGGDGASLAPSPQARHPWAWLLRRVFAIDILTCPNCQSSMKVVTVTTEPDSIRAAMADLPPSGAPPHSPALHANRQLELRFAAA